MKVDKETCINDFVRYQKVTQTYSKSGKKMGILTETIEGIESTKKGYIHQPLDDYGNFEDKPKKIPTGYKRTKKN